MADPITVTTTLITLATFIKDLIDLGQNIKNSIEKASLASVGENRRRIRDLTDDILRTLGHLADLSRGHGNSFQAPELLTALENLKARTLPPAHTRGLRGFGTQFKAWMKRDDIEGEIRRLREHVNTCYLQFTVINASIQKAFSTARTEHTSRRVENTSLRVEQALVVNNVQNHVQLQRLETMMARVLLETQFGQNIMNQTIEIISSVRHFDLCDKFMKLTLLKDPTHRTIEFQYLSIQTLHLVDALEELLLGRSGDLPWDASPRTLVLEKSPSPAHILHEVLGMVLAIRTRPTEVPTEAIVSILDNLGSNLQGLKMTSESIAWGLLRIKILRQSDRAHSAGVFPRLSRSLQQVSDQYAYQLRHDLALQASQKAVYLSQFSSESWPHRGNQTFLALSLISHSRNLRKAGHPTSAIYAAEAAVAITCPMAVGILESCLTSGPSPEDLWIAVADSKASFVLAAAFSSAGRTREAHQASKQGLQNLLRFSGTIQHISPFERDFDSFFDRLCTMAETEDLSVEMLVDCVILFRDLARIYPEEFSPRFVGVLYAYIYIGDQATTSSIGATMKSLRLLLEPKSDARLPMLPPSTDVIWHLNDFHSRGGVQEDALRGFLRQEPTPQACRFIGEIFVTNWDVATFVLRATVRVLHCRQILGHILGVLGFTSHSQLRELLPIVKEIIALPFETEDDRSSALAISSRCFWLVGALDDAVALGQEASQCADHPGSRSTCLVWKAIALHDMGHIGAAIEATKEVEIIGDQAFIWYCLAIHCCILRRTGRHKEALQFLLLGRQKSECAISDDAAEDSDILQVLHCGLLISLSTVRQHLGQTQEALQDAELAVRILKRKSVDDDAIPMRMTSLTRALATLSNSLVSLGRDSDALAAAQEAEITYKSYLSHRSAEILLLFPERPQEIGATVYFCLALRLATLNQLEEALSSAKIATNLYRELVSLAKRFLLDLAGSLQNLARILWMLHHQVESILACEEAVNIMRQVASEELYVLPALRDSLDQVAEYLVETGNVEAASAAATESAEVQRSISLLPTEMRESLEWSNLGGGTKPIDQAEVTSALPLRDSASQPESAKLADNPPEHQDNSAESAADKIPIAHTLEDFQMHKHQNICTPTDITHLESQLHMYGLSTPQFSTAEVVDVHRKIWVIWRPNPNLPFEKVHTLFKDHSLTE
ncbi:hypothetical protein C8R44DRAFT_726116 [Mycena epipterygia]|nr:hypothetical protein C8R44DRAFT_726116 [Mycena epipterygia]